MTKPRTIQPHQLDQLRADAHRALDRLCDAALQIQQRRNDWQLGYPTPGGGRHTITDPMAEHIANQLTPRLNADGTTTLRVEPDPALDATRWCLDRDQMFGLMWALDAQARHLSPTCTQPRCQQPATAGNWCSSHQPKTRDPDEPTRCDCCEQPIAGPVRRGLDHACYQSWQRAQRQPQHATYDEWRHQRRLMLGVHLRTA